MEERIEDYIKRIESIIQTLSDHIEFEDYDEDVLKEASEDKEALENLLKRYKELEEENKTKLEIYELGKENARKRIEYDYIPISVIQNLIDKLGNMLQETMEGKLQKYTPGEIIFLKRFLENLLEERN